MTTNMFSHDFQSLWRGHGYADLGRRKPARTTKVENATIKNRESTESTLIPLATDTLKSMGSSKIIQFARKSSSNGNVLQMSFRTM